jgi:Aldehyde dehydrogenase family
MPASAASLRLSRSLPEALARLGPPLLFAIRRGRPDYRVEREHAVHLPQAGLGRCRAGCTVVIEPRARRVASLLRAGRVVINGMTDDPRAPWGGFKYSGIGREYGRYGIEAFLETRAILEA